MRAIWLALCSAALAVASPALATTTGYKLPVSSSVGVSGNFWIAPPLEGRYTCPMDPDVKSSSPGICPKCKMDLELVPTTVRLQVAGMSGRTVRLGVSGKLLTSATTHFDRTGVAQAGFKLPPGLYTFTADATMPKTGKHVHFSAPYQLR